MKGGHGWSHLRGLGGMAWVGCVYYKWRKEGVVGSFIQAGLVVCTYHMVHGVRFRYHMTGGRIGNRAA